PAFYRTQPSAGSGINPPKLGVVAAAVHLAVADQPSAADDRGGDLAMRAGAGDAQQQAAILPGCRAARGGMAVQRAHHAVGDQAAGDIEGAAVDDAPLLDRDAGGSLPDGLGEGV